LRTTIQSLAIAALASASLMSSAGCSLIVDRSPQCKIDADCAHFGGHPYCKQGVCEPSGLGPDGCFDGTPQTQSDYLNACTTAAWQPFDNCGRLGKCSSDLTPPTTMDPSNPTIPPLVNPVTAPTEPCSNQGPNIIYMFGTADFAPLLKAVQPLLAAGTPRYRAIYQNSTSCNGVISVFDSTKRLMLNPTGTASNYAFYYDDDGNQKSCLLETAGNTIDVGVSNLYSTTCNTSTATYVAGSSVSDYTGPVVPFALSVPSGSSQQAISAEAAHIIFGLGGKTSGNGGWKDAAPWTDPTYYFIRNGNSGSTVLTALLIDVPKSKFWGVDRLSTDNLRDSMLATTAAEQSIGILSMDYADKNRGNLRSLYLQAKGQSCGYLPDSNKNAFDKQNVRDGHYPLWGYVHFFTPVGPGGVPSDAAKALVTRFSVSHLDQTFLDNIIAASLIPQCAMKVTRSSEEGDFSPQAGLSCGCYFDLKATGKTSCQTCALSSDCPSARPACNYGYCEVN
jgi:hypothetical protein